MTFVTSFIVLIVTSYGHDSAASEAVGVSLKRSVALVFLILFDRPDSYFDDSDVFAAVGIAEWLEVNGERPSGEDFFNPLIVSDT